MHAVADILRLVWPFLLAASVVALLHGAHLRAERRRSRDTSAPDGGGSADGIDGAGRARRTRPSAEGDDGGDGGGVGGGE
jgi:hypothetical protein